jgi:CBS domain-containing protein
MATVGEGTEIARRWELFRGSEGGPPPAEATMKVKELMTTEVRTCSSDTTVAEAAHLMWDGDCGILPVVDDGELVGVVTDRDMYIALATQDARASRLKVGAVATKTLVTCAPEDDVHDVLAAMKQARVRRLPVVGFGSTVLGIVSMNDILLAAGPGKGVASDEVVQTLQAICAHHHPAPHVVAA